MGGLFSLLILVVLAVPAAAVVAVVAALSARRRVARLEERVDDLSHHLSLLLGRPGAAPKPPAREAAPTPPPVKEPVVPPAPPVPPFPFPPIYKEEVVSAKESSPQPSPFQGEGDMAPLLTKTPPATESESGWEGFTAAKLFSWAGGVALFLGMAFLLKYSIDHNVITPLMRVLAGLAVGLGLAAAGARMSLAGGPARTAATLMGAGVAVLYADTFAAHTLYGFIGAGPAFLFMALVTATGFALAARFNAVFTAVLGLVFGFLTPVLVSTGKDRLFALVAYITLLDLGLAALVRARRWGFLWPLAGAGTGILMVGWTQRFLGDGNAAGAAAAYGFLGLLFLAVGYLHEPAEGEDPWVPQASAVVALAAMASVYRMMYIPALMERPWVLLGHVFVLDVALVAAGLRRGALRPWAVAAGGVVFLALSLLMSTSLARLHPYWMYAFVVAFTGPHALFPLLMRRRDPEAKPWHAAYVLPLLFMLPLLGPAMREAGSPALFWAAVGLIDLCLLAAAAAAGALWVVLAALGMTCALALAVLQRAAWGGGGGFLIAVVLIALGFSAAAYLWPRGRKEPAQDQAPDAAWWNPPLQSLSPLALPALLPFFLLIVGVSQNALTAPALLFSVGFLLAGLLLALAAARRVGEAPVAALAGLAALMALWWMKHGAPDRVAGTAFFYAAAPAAFMLFPFLSRGRVAGLRGPWLAAALAGPAYFWTWHRMLIPDLLPREAAGLLPAVFAAVYLCGLRDAVRHPAEDAADQRHRLACLGGAALFFITLIFPVQFNREWITLGWAAEGAALLWLDRRLKHPGLKWVGAGLLCLGFVRLALNPTVFSYHARSGTVLFNWYLYAYGAAAACLFAAARLWRGDRPPAWPRAFRAMGGVLLFLLMNIEIADAFSPGPSLTFNLRGPLAQDMAYTLGWGLFGLGCVVLGFWKGAPAARRAGTVLLAAAALKLFLHDVWRLGQLYRVGAFVGLAALLIATSFLYQKAGNRK